jgi:hypothetical protein
MTTEQLEQIEKLGRRAVACPRWRWMSGMKVAVPAGHEGDTGYYRILLSSDEPEAGAYPDLTDPATLGCLLALVREAWGSPHAYVGHSDRWVAAFRCEVGGRAFASTTEAAALVAALEAAP